MNGSYTTVQGDTFDAIAKAVYGEERRMDILIAANPLHADTVVFSAGTVLILPELEEPTIDVVRLPPWRANT